MPTDATVRLDGTGYAARTVTKVPDWHGLVAWDLLFNNLATGLFLTAAAGDLLAPEAFTPVARVAYPLALLLLLTELVLLTLDLGDPLRFHHMLRVFKPSSPMSLGTWCLTAFSFPLAAAALLSVLPGGGPALEWARKGAVVLALVPALGAGVYKGVLLSTTAQPGWRDARWLGGYLANSALLLGCAELLALAIFTGQERATAVLRPALAILLVLNAVALFLLLAELRQALARIFTPGQRWQFGLLTLGVGMLAPLCLVLVTDHPAALLAAVLFLLAGSVAIRWLIVNIPRALSARGVAARD
jgi:Ni/Fe-hydrogenase subunit HybB-like protein